VTKSDSRLSPSRSFHTLLTVAALALLVLLGIGGLKGFRDLREAREREQMLEVKIDDTRDEIRRLQQRVEDLRSDPAALERVAREEFYMLRPGEMVIVLPEDETLVRPAEQGGEEG